ncbi:hypothetical protein DZD18_00205 [Rhodobacteraceae bacterium W635]|uniref:hypothetical protein n=1 Tax=Nioella halotolerans TaxID=2303578 RepID=UPI000E3D1054|nr:hypothetical protein DZD18_00205 [Rhodobacteraceae bacterium W635]
MVYIVPLFCFVIPLIVGVVAMRCRMGWVVPVLSVPGALIIAWAIWKGRQMTGFGGIGYAIVAVLMAAPAILGVLSGGLIGWLRRRHPASKGPPGLEPPGWRQ